MKAADTLSVFALVAIDQRDPRPFQCEEAAQREHDAVLILSQNPNRRGGESEHKVREQDTRNDVRINVESRSDQKVLSS